jgi:acyl dehydratase
MVESEFRIAGGLIGLSGEVSWPRATYAGDTIRVEIEILDVRVSASKPDRGIVTVRNTTLNQRNEPVQIGVFKMLVPRRPAASI